MPSRSRRSLAWLPAVAVVLAAPLHAAPPITERPVQQAAHDPVESPRENVEPIREQVESIREHGESENQPASDRDPGVRVLFDERYSDSEGDAGRLDLYVPRSAPPSGGRPVVVVIHGGGWTSGDKWTTAGYCRQLAKRGYVAVNINYRLAPQHKFPSQVDDVRQALLWVVDAAERFEIDTDRVGLFGYSAGGHLSTLVGMLTDRSPESQQMTSNWPADDPRWGRLPKIRAVCAGGPPCDFRDLPPANTMLAYFLGGSRAERPEIYDAASPTHHASPDAPVTQIIHGETDLIVPVASSRALYQALTDCGADCRYELIPGQGHMVTFLHPKTESTMLDFFDEVLQTSTSPNAPSP